VPDVPSARRKTTVTSASFRNRRLCFPQVSLERDIAELLTRPVGRPSHKPVVRYKSFLYQAESWAKARRVVARVECNHLAKMIVWVLQAPTA